MPISATNSVLSSYYVYESERKAGFPNSENTTLLSRLSLKECPESSYIGSMDSSRVCIRSIIFQEYIAMSFPTNLKVLEKLSMSGDRTCDLQVSGLLLYH